MRHQGAALAAGLALVLAACGSDSGSGGAAARGRQPAPVRVFAAASLTSAFEAIATAFAAQPGGGRVEPNFAGSPQLVLQLREGAAADVFAAADQPNMARVVALGRTAGAPVEFARNHLAIVVAAGNRKQVRGLADLARADVKVVLCGPEVPAGRYARTALDKAGVDLESVSDEPSVKAVVAKVQLGEADAGVVYATDVRGKGVEAVAVDPVHDVVASYPIVVLQGGGNQAGGAAFVAFVRSDAGRAILREHGFVAP